MKPEQPEIDRLRREVAERKDKVLASKPWR
jgi:hypothetical protein